MEPGLSLFLLRCASLAAVLENPVCPKPVRAPEPVLPEPHLHSTSVISVTSFPWFFLVTPTVVVLHSPCPQSRCAVGTLGPSSEAAPTAHLLCLLSARINSTCHTAGRSPSLVRTIEAAAARFQELLSGFRIRSTRMAMPEANVPWEQERRLQLAVHLLLVNRWGTCPAPMGMPFVVFGLCFP